MYHCRCPGFRSGGVGGVVLLCLPGCGRAERQGREQAFSRGEFPKYSHEEGIWGFYQYYDLKNVTRDPSVDLTAYDLPVLEEHMFHVIRGKDNYILIELK